MKIIDRKTFLEMPEGTVFTEYTPCCFDAWAVKGETIWHTWPHDFFYRPLIEVESISSEDYADKLQLSQEDGISLELDHDCGSRDGGFVATQLYAVLEQKDISGLIESLASLPRFS